MPELLVAVGLAAAVGYASALLPVVNAEAAALAGGAITSVPGAVAVSLALAVGQTAGKVTIFLGVRTGHRLRRTPGPADHAKPARPGRLRRLGQRLLARLEHRGTGAGVVLLAGAAGVPPLLLVSAVAGTSRMRLLDFTLCCLAGRWLRFAVIAIPTALAVT
jgi:membrane protein YqaA with SNARE-associated domain